MKILLCISFILMFGLPNSSSAIFDTNTSGGASIFGDNGSSNPYCNNADCGLNQGIETVRSNVNGIETGRSFSQYIQDIVEFLLGFLAIVAVIYIIYAGFVMLTSAGDDEKVTQTKKTVIYVIIGLAIIYLAGPIAEFVFRVLSES